MEYEAVEVVALSEGREVLACLRRMVVVEFDNDSALYELVRAFTTKRDKHTIVVSSAMSVAILNVRTWNELRT
jgi:hypothetical protein